MGMAQKDLHLRVLNMHCAACAQRVEKALKAVPGVLNASVVLAADTASVSIDPDKAKVETLVQAVAAEGYEVPPDTVRLAVTGMHCEHCVRTVTQALNAVPGVVNARVSLETNDAVVEFFPWWTSLDQLRRAVLGAGYQADIAERLPA